MSWGLPSYDRWGESRSDYEPELWDVVRDDGLRLIERTTILDADAQCAYLNAKRPSGHSYEVVAALGGSMSEHRTVRLDHLLGVYEVGSGEWSWQDEYDKLIDRSVTRQLLASVEAEGIREPILLGNDGRVWDGHHRVVAAMHIGIDSVPVEFSGHHQADQGKPQITEDDERIDAWEKVAKHPVFQQCFEDERPLIDSMTDRLTDLREMESTVNELRSTVVTEDMVERGAQVLEEWANRPVRFVLARAVLEAALTHQSTDLESR